MMQSGDRDDPVVDIVRVLLKRTRDRRAKWKTTDDSKTYLYTASDSSVVIRSWIDSANDLNVGLDILNSAGEAVASLKSTWPSPDEAYWLEEDTNASYVPGRYNPLLEELYEAARRSALNIDGVLSSLRRDLDAE